MIMEEDFSIDDLVRRMKKPEIGAIVTFLGIVRDEKKELKGMKIEVSKLLVEKELDDLKKNALERFEIEDVEIIHREGSLKVGDDIVVILVAAKHRKDAFRACEYLIDELKLSEAIMEKELR
jgi:molybdopterin synthase catalytic subunit